MGTYTKTPTIYQMEATECGAASLSMIFAYFGKYKPLEEMRIETGVSRDGCKAGNIVRCAKKYGLETHGYCKNAEYLRTVQPPCILHWNMNHFVVFEGVKGNYAYLNDPAAGRRKLTFEELEDGFSGVVITFSLTDRFQKEKKKRTAGRLIRQRLSGQYGIIFKLIYVGLLLVFPGLVLPILSQVFMDDVLVGGYTDWLMKILVFMGALLLMKSGLSYYRSRMLKKLSSKLTLLSGYGFLRHLFRLPSNFFDQRYVGDLVSRMDNNSSINDVLAGDLAETILNIFIAVFYLFILLLYSPLLTVIGLINVAVCLVAALISNRAIAGATMKMQINGGKLFGAVCAGLSITDTIKASGAEQEYSSRILGYQAKQGNMEQDMSRFQKIVGIIPKAMGQITDAFLLLAGGLLVMHGELTVGMLLAFNTMFDSFCEPVNALVSFTQKIQTMKADLSRVEDILNYPEDFRYSNENDEASKKIKSKLSGRIELKDISFGYSRLQAPLIENFSFKLNSGDSIAFVGASGSGKSTVAKVVSGLYQPWTGEVLVDGNPLNSIDRSVLNTSIATVSQNIVLFTGSIRDNIKMWNSLISDDDMIQAAKDAEIHDFILTLPNGYDYVLTEGASNLSGGQRQRMEIARALVTNPTILIMDEATSALDPLVEKDILDNIRRRGCTCVIVAHRLSAIRDCSQIVVMKHGKIIQHGDHKTLKNEDGYYRSFVQNI